MGLFNNGTDTVQQQRARVRFVATGETENGLSFGTSFRVTADTTTSAAAIGTAAVFVSGAFGTLSFGPDNDNAAAATAHRTPHLGVLENAGGSRSDRYGVGSGVLYTFSSGDLSLAASTDIGGANDSDFSVAAKYSLGDVSVAVAYTNDAATAAVPNAVVAGTETLLTAGGSLAGINFVAVYGMRDLLVGADVTQTALSAAYTMDAVTVTVRMLDSYADVNHVGAGLVYDLGGGARLGASINRVDGGDTTSDLGLSFSF